MLFEKVFKGKIDYIAIWNKFLSDKIVSQVSGVSKILVSDFTPRQLAIKAYNDFYLASKSKDIDQTIALGLRMRKFMAADKKRPSYHLTSPMGRYPRSGRSILLQWQISCIQLQKYGIAARGYTACTLCKR